MDIRRPCRPPHIPCTTPLQYPTTTAALVWREVPPTMSPLRPEVAATAGRATTLTALTDTITGTTDAHIVP